ncbi:putative Androglobin [Hypsibius exemplaris]|uniref:Androglobin n=1 Tax=Hypsibius exemplaris TaxID=2072580 RepID=A0A1W0WR01_HYPEX|nr:putative Androglobin [Hypsibius exemplaris]
MTSDALGQNYTGLITIWPEWTEQDLLTEKWDVQAAGAGTKSAKDPKVKGASFEDPEGRTRLPHSLLRVLKDWKRPQELFGENLCIVRNTIRINLKEPNAHILHSEFIRHYLSHVTLLWYLAQRKKFSLKNHPVISVAPPPPPAPATEMTSKTSVGSHKGSKHTIGKDTSASKTSQGAESPVKCLCFEDPLIDWAPWNFIYGGPPSAPRAANVKGEVAYVVSNLPQYNPNGKYAVKLFWMGAWRKVVVDDYIPVDEHNRPLLPVCNEPNELWPLILTKAVMKVVSLDYGGNTGSSEMGDAGFVLHVLTGYTPHVIYLRHPKSTRKAIWNKLQALLPLNKKPPPEDVLSALSENWDIRNCAALRTWTAQSDPAYLQKVDTIRANRLQTAAAPAPSPGLATQSVTSSTLGAANTLAPKPLVRSASARNSSNAPRKLELSSPNNALTLSLSVPSDLPRIKNPKTPEVLIYASYRSAHHEPGMFDQEEHSRSANLYDSGFLRAESHPILLRNIRDVPPKLPTRSPVPRYKLFRPLRINPDRYSQIILRDHRRREHSIRSIDFLSLLWTEKGRLTHQTASRANHLTEEQDPDTQNRVRWKPTDGFKPSLSAIPENCLFPRKKTVRHLSELIVKPSSPPPTPSHEEKASKNKGGEPGKPPANQAVPEQIPLPSLPPPSQSQEEIQKHCRLNRGSIEFNRFFESLESIYIFTKPETFDYQSTFSFYQSNILIDGRPPPTKKKGGDQMSQQIVGGSESSRPNQTKPPSSPNPGRFAKVTVELPSPYLMVDNPYPTCIVLGISTVSRWFFAPKSEVKSQERMSVVAGTIEELKGMERPLPVIVTLKHHDWMFARSEPAILSIKTSSVQGVCYQIPAGRHIFRLKVVCPGRRDLEPHGFCIRSFSRDPVHIGPEDVILKMAAVDSYQYSILARKALLPIVRWWRLNGSPTFTHPPHREIIATLGLEEEAHNKFTRRVFFDAMLAAFYKAMEVYLHEFCTTKGAFTLRVFIGDLTTRNILNLSKAQLAKKDSKNAVSQPVASSKGDSHATPGGRQVEGGGKKTKQKGGELSVGSPSHKGSSGFAIAERESVRDKTVLLKREKPLLVKKVLHKDKAKASTIWAMYFQVAKATNVLQARKSGSKKKEAVLKMAQKIQGKIQPVLLLVFGETVRHPTTIDLFHPEFPFQNQLYPRRTDRNFTLNHLDMLEALLRNEQPFASCFFRNLCRNLPADWLDLDFFFRHERRYISREIAGNFPDFPANTWKLFLRDTFYVQEPLWIAFRLATTIAAMRLTVVNNDTGRPLPSTLFHNLPHLYEKNTAGYTLVAEAKSGTLGWRGAPWSLRIIQALDPFLHESTQADNLLVKFNTASPMTTFVTKELNDYFLPDLSSNPTLARVSMTVKHHSTVSICFMTSNPEARFFVQITNKDNCLYKGQGRGILVIPALYLKSSEPPAPEVFSLKAICLDDSWAFSGPEWKYAFTEKSKRISVEYGRESPSTPPSTSPVKGEKPAVKKTTKSSKDREKEDKSDKESVDSFRSKGKDGKDKVLFDTTKPHWLAKFVIDTTDNEFQVVRDLSMDEAVKTELHESIVADPGVLQRGKDFREDYLRKRAGSGFTSPESVDYPGWTTGTPRPVWPAPTAPFPLSFDLANFHRPAAGDAPEELDLFVHQNSMRVLSNRYTEAVQAKEDYLARERTDRDTIIRQQTNMIKVLVDATISERRKYIEQREVKKKQLDDRALEEERLLKPVVVADHHHPKTDEKRKKSKKPV